MFLNPRVLRIDGKKSIDNGNRWPIDRTSFCDYEMSSTSIDIDYQYQSISSAAIGIYLSHKLRCYTRISGPEKSRNNTREKMSYFFTCVDIANQLHDTSLAFGATQSGWWMNGKAFTILNTSCLSELSRIMAAKALKNPYR